MKVSKFLFGFLIVILASSLFPFPLKAQSSKISRINSEWSDWLNSLVNWTLENKATGDWLPSSGLTISWRSLDNQTIKYSLNFTAPVRAQYRLNVTINNILNGTAGTNQITLNRWDGDIIFNWTDTAQLSYSKTSRLIGNLADSNKTYSWSILTPIINKGAKISIDPGITRVQGNARGTSSYSTAVAATLSGTPVDGNVLVATIGIEYYGTNTVAISGITENKVTWTYQIRRYYMNVSDGHGLDVEIWYGVISGSGASKTASATINSSSNDRAVIDVCEYSGLAVTDFLDQTATNTGYGTSLDTGTTSTTSQNDELWIGATDVMTSATLSNPTNDFALLDGTATGSCSLAYLEKIVTATGSANSGCTASTKANWEGCIATFKAAAGGPTTYIVNLTQSVTAGFTVLLKTTFQSILSLSSTVGLSIVNKAAFTVVTAFSATAGFLIDLITGHIGISYLVNLALNPTTTFLSLLKTNFRVVLNANPTVTITDFLKTNYNLVLTLNPGVGLLIDLIFEHITGIRYYVNLLFNPTTTITALVNANYNVILGWNPTTLWELVLPGAVVTTADVALALGALAFIIAMTGIGLFALRRRD